MKELADILQAYPQLVARGTGLAMATVVRVQGSAYRRPGARMLIAGDGCTVGGVSGGCLERDVIQRAGAIMLSHQPALVRYDTSQDPETGSGGSGYSLGCGGAIDVLIESLNAPAGIELTEMLKSSRTHPVVVATVVSKRHPSIMLGERLMMVGPSTVTGQMGNEAFSKAVIEDAGKALARGHSEFLQYPTPAGIVEIFLEVIAPPLDLVIFGAGSDALPLVGFAKALGWKVTVVDVRSSAQDPGRVWEADQMIRCPVEQVGEHVLISESTAAVVMTHNFEHDSQLIRWLSTKPLRYLGLLGPRHRTEQVVAGLLVEQLHSPVGLDIGADNPQEVALSIVAEITAVLRGRSGLSLRSTDGPIHVGNMRESQQSRGVPPRTGPARPGSVYESDYKVPSCPTAGL